MKTCLGCFRKIRDELEICPHCGYVEGSTSDEAIHLLPGTELKNNRYIVGKVNRYDGFGATYLAWDKRLEQQIAIKEYLPSEFSTRTQGQVALTIFQGEKYEQFELGKEKFIDEARRLAKFQNEEGIIKVFDFFTENNTAYLVTENLEGKTLASIIEGGKVFDTDEAKELLLPVMRSLQRVHADGILHRDISPENIFVTLDGKAKLVDFGAARFATTSHSRSLTVIVKPGYSPEEQYRSRGDQGSHTDVYALAATMYKMITGITPPDAYERRASIQNSKRDKLIEPRRVNRDVSKVVENAILNATNVQIEDRTPNIAQFISDLNSDVPVARRYGRIRKIDFYRWPLWLKITVPTILVAIIVFVLLLVTGVISFKSLFSSEMVLPENMVRVPQVTGLPREEAIEAVLDAGLLYEIEASVTSEYLDKNSILIQTPLGGSIQQYNSIVYLTICDGDGSDPGVLYKTEEELSVIFSEDNITYTIEYEYSNTQEGLSNRVLLSDGTEVEYLSEIEYGSSVVIYISLGQEPIIMPNLYGMSLEEAETMLIEIGLVADSANYIFVESDELEDNHILGQSISEGEEVTLGTQIVLTVVANKTLVEVPSVVGLNENDARELIENAGFAIRVYEEPSNTVSSGDVIRQEPSANILLEEGMEVILYVSSGIEVEVYATPTPTPLPTATPTPIPTNTPTPVPTATSTPVPVASEGTPSVSATPTITSTPTPTMVPLSFDAISDVEIHMEEGESSATVSLSVSPTADLELSVLVGDSDVCSTTVSNTRLSITAEERGTTDITVVASNGYETIEQVFELRVYDYVYGSWSSVQRSTSPVENNGETIRHATPYEGDEVTGSRHVSCILDYWLVGNTSCVNGRAFYNWDRTDDEWYRYSPAELEVECSDGYNPDGYTSVPPGGRSYGPQSGTNNTSDATGYYINDSSIWNGDGRMYFIMRYIDEDVYTHYYYYQTRERSVSCE